MSRLVIASNRVAIPDPGDGRKAAAGGLAVALEASLRKSGGLWFGWSGEVSPQRAQSPKFVDVKGVSYATIDLTPTDRNEYYNGYANRTLWPLFHYRTDLTAYDQEFYEGYSRVNAQFAQEMVKLLEPGDTIWVHDYHLIPLGKLLRRAGCPQPIGFFLHIPFPATQILLTLPNHKAIVRALFAYDLIGFQTETDLAAFRDYVLLEADGLERPSGTFHAYGRTVRAGSFPISVDRDDLLDMAMSPVSRRQYERLMRSLEGRQMILGVDRLDYTKGLHERLRAFEHFLETKPGALGNVTLIQIAPGSRSTVPEYQAMRDELELSIGHINGLFAEPDWVPIRYLGRSFSRPALTAFYRAADVALITPFRDGMNLVAMEYVTVQDPADPGVLVLSRFAGAASQLPGAVIVNPHDVTSVADALSDALSMPLAERQKRWRINMRRINAYDVNDWQSEYLSRLEGAAEMKAA